MAATCLHIEPIIAPLLPKPKPTPKPKPKPIFGDGRLPSRVDDSFFGTNALCNQLQLHFQKHTSGGSLLLWTTSTWPRWLVGVIVSCARGVWAGVCRQWRGTAALFASRCLQTDTHGFLALPHECTRKAPTHTWRESSGTVCAHCHASCCHAHTGCTLPPPRHHHGASRARGCTI